MSTQLEGKRALITGAGSGIGRAIAGAYAEAGCRVVVGDVSGVEQVAAELGGDALGVACDVRSTADVAGLVDAAVGHLGGLDLLVNNAGVETLAPLHEVTEEQFDQIIGVNLRGTWLVYKHAVPALIDGGGAVLNVASLAGLAGFPLLGAYCASKGGCVRMTEVMALELRDHGVRANAICPGFVDTPMVDRAAQAFEAATGQPFDVVVARQGRLGTPEEVAALAVFLGSDQAAFISGSAFAIDGGLNVQRL
ncbi:SDR family NAD(P)-dependent oxidoreductase [Patulibacter defluvii]|uniref:SDR family NAD(P)-dependent oxidoreductase n=1 Tax=Patulibacter defluvii TaxID=3095358 RepID=UPI002A75533F|nr:SDR family NAD(P)-dependent oxidoreductase [Patulibacter sp. DM4]